MQVHSCTLACLLEVTFSHSVVVATPVHPEFTGYKLGAQINQADVALLQYPLNFPMARDVKVNDLTYYSSVTRTNGTSPFRQHKQRRLGHACDLCRLTVWWMERPGYFTGDSSYSIAWLAMGNRTAADPWLQAAYLHMDLTHFNVWKERAITGGNLNFITGAGGYLQNFLYGYSQLRLSGPTTLDMAIPAMLPQGNVTRQTLRGVSLAGVRFTLSYDASQVCFSLVAPPAVPSESAHQQVNGRDGLSSKPVTLQVLCSSASQPCVPRMTTGPPACVALQPLRIRVAPTDEL